MPADAADLHQRRRRKRERDPVAQASRASAGATWPSRSRPRSALAVRTNQSTARVRAGSPSTRLFGGPSSRAVEAVRRFSMQLDARAAFLEPAARRPRGEERERALRAEQIGHAHRAQLGAVELVRRKRDRHAEHRAPDVVIAENRPERPGLAQQAQFGPAQRNAKRPSFSTRSTRPM